MNKLLGVRIRAADGKQNFKSMTSPKFWKHVKRRNKRARVYFKTRKALAKLLRPLAPTHILVDAMVIFRLILSVCGYGWQAFLSNVDPVKTICPAIALSMAEYLKELVAGVADSLRPEEPPPPPRASTSSSGSARTGRVTRSSARAAARAAVPPTPVAAPADTAGKAPVVPPAMIVIFDGNKPELKKKRRGPSMRKNKSLLNTGINNYGFFRRHGSKGRGKKQINTGFRFPHRLVRAVAYAFKLLPPDTFGEVSFSVKMAKGEADHLIGAYAKLYPKSIVFSSDSDYPIFTEVMAMVMPQWR